MEESKLSKTKKKKAAQEVYHFIKKVAKLTKKQIEALELPDQVKEEIIKCTQIKSYIAYNRQIKFVSKIMLSVENYRDLMQKIDSQKHF